MSNDRILSLLKPTVKPWDIRAQIVDHGKCTQNEQNNTQNVKI